MSGDSTTTLIRDGREFAKGWISRWQQLGNGITLHDGQVMLWTRMEDPELEERSAALRAELDVPGGRQALRSVMEELRPLVGQRWS